MTTNSGFEPLRLDEPVIVLTCGRSGSTLLRLILDAHPSLACPAETNIVKLAVQMGSLWKMLENRGQEGELTKLAASSIRLWVNTTYTTYLVQAGKKRWCDKSLGTAGLAHLFLTLFPKTKFVCLYRQCMDMIDSGIEACPWGLKGYGFEQFVGAYPGNNVAALADYWVMFTRQILTFEKTHPDICHRVRYEDLVADPEASAARIFRFLGVDQVPGISQSCFNARENHLSGPSDHKIWATSEVRTESVGRGARIPAAAIPKPVLDLVNPLHEELGYPLVDREGWNQQMPAASAPVRFSDRSPADRHLDGRGLGELNDPLDEIEEMLQARLAGPLVTTGGPGRSETPLSLIATAKNGTAIAARCWQLDFGKRRISRADADSAPGMWVITAETGTWRSVLTGEANLATVVRQGYLRCAPAKRLARSEQLRIGHDSDEGIRIFNDLLAVPTGTVRADAK